MSKYGVGIIGCGGIFPSHAFSLHMMEETEVKERPSEARIHEAIGLNEVQVFVVACPKDLTMYKDAVKTTGFENRLIVKDLIELVHEAL